ncbi:uncharacterized protein LOC134229432 [Saccostrea cucullata]|uniref:uncharacterized protein LOC134229432 n=1 Tax=Saccostrea cuccullata TaxID=36930 RepID=UPI002ED391EC
MLSLEGQMVMTTPTLHQVSLLMKLQRPFLVMLSLEGQMVMTTPTLHQVSLLMKLQRPFLVMLSLEGQMVMTTPTLHQVSLLMKLQRPFLVLLSLEGWIVMTTPIHHLDMVQQVILYCLYLMYCRKEMSKWNETPKRVVMYFAFKIGKSQVETVMMVNQTRRRKNVNERLLHRWFQRFWAELNMEFIAKHVNNIVNTLSEMMNCSLTKCDEGDHKRHHDFIKSPEKTYTENYIKYYFGAKYIEPEDFEYLQEVLGERMCTNKLLPGVMNKDRDNSLKQAGSDIERIHIFVAYSIKKF